VTYVTLTRNSNNMLNGKTCCNRKNINSKNVKKDIYKIPTWIAMSSRETRKQDFF